MRGASAGTSSPPSPGARHPRAPRRRPTWRTPSRIVGPGIELGFYRLLSAGGGFTLYDPGQDDQLLEDAAVGPLCLHVLGVPARRLRRPGRPSRRFVLPRLRRHHRREPPAGPSGGGGDRGAVRRGADRARLRRRGARGDDRAQPNARVLQDEERRGAAHGRPARSRQVLGGLLVQDRDARPRTARRCRSCPSVSRRGGVERDAVRLARVQARQLERDRARPDLATVGIGAGQMSRVDSVRLAVEKSQAGLAARARRSRPTRSSRSPTAPELAIRAAVELDHPARRIDSQRPSVVEAADAAGIVMVFTSRRHFRH